MAMISRLRGVGCAIESSARAIRRFTGGNSATSRIVPQPIGPGTFPQSPRPRISQNCTPTTSSSTATIVLPVAVMAAARSR
jgi:hypothetical protein